MSDLPQLIYGWHPVLEALEANHPIEKILLRKGISGRGAEQLLRITQERNIPVQEVPQEKLNRTTRGQHQGLIAFRSVVPNPDIQDIVAQIFDVRNMGAIARSALCFGAHALVIPSRGSALISEDTIKSSAGALLHLPLCRVWNLKDTIRELKESGLHFFAVHEKGELQPSKADLNQPLMLMLGSEHEGISPAYLSLADSSISIPQTGPVSSLNVSVAAGILAYETFKQRKA
jgi:23S rRNA (guanosine2251-2'-O)-methyltransferase